jgi:hypothetical protein
MEDLMSSPHVTARLILSPYYPGNWILLVGDRVLLAGPLDDCVAALLSLEARARAGRRVDAGAEPHRR